MKHQTINLVKFKALAKRLNAPLCHVVGYLETLWIFCQIQAQDGDLSSFTPLEIAGWIEYPGDPETLIDALIETRWLDRVGDQLLVHDWADHKPNWLKGVHARRAIPHEPGTQPSNEPSTQPGSGPGSTPPNLTQPNLTQPNPNLTQPNPNAAASWKAAAAVDLDVDEVRALAQRMFKAKPLLAKHFVWAVCWTGLAIERGLVDDWIDKLSSGDVQKPKRYLEAALDSECSQLGFRWADVLKLFAQPEPVAS